MPSRFSRWRLLTFLAIVNLVCWVGAAVAVGMAASDRVDLGVETFVREHRATAVSMWNQASTPSRMAATRPPIADRQPQRGEVSTAVITPTDSIVWPATQAEAAPTSRPSEQVQVSQPAQPSPMALSVQPTPQTQASQPTPATDLPNPSPQPTETPVRTPLLMSNPEITTLQAMDAEMQRSAVGRTVQITYQETVLNDEIAAYMENHPELPFHSVEVNLKRDRIVVSGEAMVLRFPVSVTAAGTVSAVDCRPQIEVTDISLSGILTPRIVQNQVEDLIHKSVEWYPPDYALCIHQIVLEEDRATIYGSRQ
jgi:hypothetical protein